MLSTIGLFVAPGDRDTYKATPGRMTTQWIAEHRDSRPS
jgi:hypothetical protein